MLRTTRALLPNGTRSSTIKLTQWPKQGVPRASDLLRHCRALRRDAETRWSDALVRSGDGDGDGGGGSSGDEEMPEA